MKKPPRWCPWISTAKRDLDSFSSARNRFCNQFPSKHIWREIRWGSRLLLLFWPFVHSLQHMFGRWPWGTQQWTGQAAEFIRPLGVSLMLLLSLTNLYTGFAYSHITSTLGKHVYFYHRSPVICRLWWRFEKHSIRSFWMPPDVNLWIKSSENWNWSP